MNGRRRKKRSGVGAFKMPDGYAKNLMAGAKIGAGVVAGKALGQFVGEMVSKKVPIKKEDGQTIMEPGEVKETVSGLIQLAGGVVVSLLLSKEKGDTFQRISEGMIGSGMITAASSILKKMKVPGFSGIPYGSTYLPGVGGGSPGGSVYIPGVGAAPTVVIE